MKGNDIKLAMGLCALLALSAGCGGDDDDDDTPEMIREDIGPDGGTIAIAGGGSLEIPAGALADDRALGAEVLTELPDYQALPDFVEGPPLVTVALTPHGTTFAEPVTLRLPFTGSPDDLVVLRAAAPGSPWDSVGPVHIADGIAAIEVRTFSIYTLVKAVTCPCFSGAELTTFLERGVMRTPVDGFRQYLTDSEDSFVLPGLLARSLQAGFINGAVAAQAGGDLTTFEGSSSGRCHAVAPIDQYASYWPMRTPTRMDAAEGYFEADVDERRFLSCRALVRAATSGTPARQIAVLINQGLPTDRSLTLSLNDGPSFTVEANEELVFAPGVLFEGDDYAVEIVTQPDGVVCTLDAGATGTVAGENILVTANCADAGPTITVASFCASVDTLMCADFDMAACNTEFDRQRDVNLGDCADEFIEILDCISGDLDANLDCVASGVGVEPVMPSPDCQMQIDSYNECNAV